MPEAAPQQHAARTLLRIDVRYRSFAVHAAVPVEQRFQSCIGLAHGFVTGVKQIRIEKRQMVVSLERAGHVLADASPVTLGLVLMLETHPASERSDRKTRHITRCKHVVAAAR